MVVHKKGELAVSAMAARAKAEVEARFVIALNRPRKHLEVRQRVLDACKRPAFAEAAIYRKPVGGSTVDGFSIRFAEEAIKSLGNISVESPIIWEDDEKRTVRITVTDLESNTSYSKDVNLSKTVERRNIKTGQNVLGERKNSVGQTVYLVEATEDELAQKVAAAESKIIRNEGLRLVPSDILDEAWDAVLATQKKGGGDPQAEVKKVVDAFAGINVGPSELERYLGHALATVSASELADLRSVYTAIKDGDAAWNDYVTAKPAPESAAAAGVKKAESPKKQTAIEVQSEKVDPKPAPAPLPKAPTPKSPTEKLADLRAKIAESGVTEAAVVAQCRLIGILDESLDLDQAVEMQPVAISTALNGFKSILAAIQTPS